LHTFWPEKRGLSIALSLSAPTLMTTMQRSRSQRQDQDKDQSRNLPDYKTRKEWRLCCLSVAN